jgi:tetratricopeptide (TPR) repeat protein
MTFELERIVNQLSEEGKWFFISQLKYTGVNCSEYEYILRKGLDEPITVDGTAELKALVNEINITPVREKRIDGVILLDERDCSSLIEGRKYLSADGFVLLGEKDSLSIVEGRDYLRLELNGIEQGIYLDLNKHKEAIAICERFNDYENAAKIYETVHEYECAMDSFEKAKNFSEARRIADACKYTARAMINAEKSGNFLRAEIYASELKDKKSESLYKEIVSLTVKVVKRKRPKVKIISGPEKAI